MSATITSVDPFEGIKTLTFDNEADWLHERLKFVGSSEIATLVGEGYADSSAMSLWTEKTGKLDHAWTDEQLQRLEAGKIGEPYARRMFELESGLTAHFDEQPTVRWNPDYPAFSASLDAWTFISDRLVTVELKIIHPIHLWDYKQDVLPQKFQLQSLQQIAVTDAHEGILCVVCGTEVLIHQIPRHQELIDALHVEAEHFLELVRTNTPPDIDGSKATATAITRLYPEVDPDSVVELGERFDGLAQRRDRLKAAEKHCAEQSQAIDNQIKMALGEAEYAVQSDSESFSWKKTAAGRRSFRRLTRIPAAVRKVLRDRE